MAKPKTKTILIGGTLITITAILAFLSLTYNFKITDLTGDISCAGTKDNPCVSEFLVYNPNNFNVAISNTKGKLVQFSPTIKEYEFYIDSGKGYQKVNLSAPKSKITFPSNKSVKIKLVGYKNSPEDTIKWGFYSERGDLDPYWNGVYANKIEVIYS